MNTSIIIALIAAGIILLLAGAWILGKGYLRSLFSEPEPVKARRVYPRAACPFCGKSYAVREGWPITFIHHNETRCAATVGQWDVSANTPGPMSGVEKE